MCRCIKPTHCKSAQKTTYLKAVLMCATLLPLRQLFASTRHAHRLLLNDVSILVMIISFPICCIHSSTFCQEKDWNGLLREIGLLSRDNQEISSIFVTLLMILYVLYQSSFHFVIIQWSFIIIKRGVEQLSCSGKAQNKKKFECTNGLYLDETTVNALVAITLSFVPILCEREATYKVHLL